MTNKVRIWVFIFLEVWNVKSEDNLFLRPGFFHLMEVPRTGISLDYKRKKTRKFASLYDSDISCHRKIKNGWVRVKNSIN